MSGYHHIRRTHSTYRHLQKLRELEVDFKIQDTATLVSAYNEARTSQEHNAELLLWIGKYVPLFEKETISECCHKALEFVQLAHIIPQSPSETRLLEDVFSALCHKIHWGNYGESKLIEAFTYFLLSIDCKVFASNPHPLTKIARDVMKKLGPDQTFSRGTYPTHSISLLALHHICTVIHEVDPSEFDHDKQEGLYQEMNRCLQNIIDSQSYYPFYFQATMIQQSLSSMDSNTCISAKERWYRLLCGVKGTAYFGQALIGAVSMSLDLDSLEKGIKEWRKACVSRRIKQNSWYATVQPLIDSRILVQHDSDKLSIFEECLSQIEEIQDETENKTDQVALRFAMIHQASLLALDCHNEGIIEWAIEKLRYFGKCCDPGKRWAEDTDILEAMVASVLNVRQKEKFKSRMEGILATIRFHVKTEELTKIITHWEHIAQWKKENSQEFTSKDRRECESLFNKIRKDMSLDDSVYTRVDTVDMLKKYYQQHSEVPSLFENEPSRHVNTLDYSLLLYQKVFEPNSQVKVVKRPIPLEDLFKNRQVSPESLDDQVKRVLLFGNPGTEKTTVAKQIAYKWSVDQWGDAFDMLYLIPVRELSSSNYDDSTIRRQRNLETAITNICFSGESDETYEALRSQVKEELDKENTLIVFDGLDEGDKMTKDMILATKYKSCRVMVLSRPQNLHSERNLANVEVECIGLNDEQLVKFIESECLSTELVEHLQTHSNVWEISHTPVVANILAFLYKTQKEYVMSEESSFNMYSLYWKMSVQMWNRYVEKTKSNMVRDMIFGALEEIAFHALKDGHIFIGQEMVHEVSRDRQTSNVLKDSGFLLLKKEGSFYQFPHLTFQEFFAGQYMAHSLLSRDEEKRKEGVEFLKENKYCPNFRQVFCFMIQALTLKNRDKGYLQVESIVNDGPTALGHQHHLLLNMEFLEASLSVSRLEDRERILDSTEVLDKAFEWIQHRECYDDALAPAIFTSEKNRVFDQPFDTSINEATEEFTNLFVQIAKAAKCVPEQYKKVKEILEKYLADKKGTKAVLCILPLMRAIPEERSNLLDLYCSLIASSNVDTFFAALSHMSDTARLMPNAPEQVFDRYKSVVLTEGGALEELGFAVDFPRLAELMPDRWQEILRLIKRTCLNRGISEPFGLNQLGRLVEFVPESRSKVMELIRELTFSGQKPKIRLSLSCLTLIKAMPDNAAEIARILWTLCEDGDKAVCDVAKEEVIRIMLSKGEIEDSAIDALLRLSDRRPMSSYSSFVQVSAIAHKLTEETRESANCVLSRLRKEDLSILWEGVAFCILDLIGTKTEREMGLHRLHFMIVKAVRPPEVDWQELHMMMDNMDSDPNKVAVMSGKLTSIAQCPARQLVAPIALSKLASCCPEHEEDLFNSIDALSQDEVEEVAREACIQMFSLLEKFPNRAEKVMNSLQESLHRFKCLDFLRMRESVCLDSLFDAYMKCHNDFLIFWIVWQSFDTPITMEARRNGKTELIVQISSNNKKRYKFQTVEEAKAFATSFDECIEVVFPDVALLVPKLGSQERQQSNNCLFANLRVRLTSSSW